MTDSRIVVIASLMSLLLHVGMGLAAGDAATPVTGPLATAEGCQVWPLNSHPDATANWSGSCAGGLASGSGVFVLRWADKEERYTGEMRDGKANGRGAFGAATGERYEGEWRDGQANGQGTAVFPDGSRYEGEWQKGAATGQGSFVWANGTHYEGQWLNNKRSGHGVNTLPNGTRYEGEWSDDKANGQGALTDAKR